MAEVFEALPDNYLDTGFRERTVHAGFFQ